MVSRILYHNVGDMPMCEGDVIAYDVNMDTDLPTKM